MCLHSCYVLFLLKLGELGDYDSEEHPEGYVSGYRFVPNQVLCVCSVVYNVDHTNLLMKTT